MPILKLFRPTTEGFVNIVYSTYEVDFSIDFVLCTRQCEDFVDYIRVVLYLGSVYEHTAGYLHFKYSEKLVQDFKSMSFEEMDKEIRIDCLRDEFIQMLLLSDDLGRKELIKLYQCIWN